MSQSFTLAELERRLLNVIRFGTIASVDLDAATCRVKLTDDHTTGDLPWQTQRAGNVRVWTPPTFGEQVTLLSPAGDLAQAIVLPALFQNEHPANAASDKVFRVDFDDDGSFFSHDQETGDTVLSTTGNLTLVATGNVQITGARIDLN